jgi:hypothetical protein
MLDYFFEVKPGAQKSAHKSREASLNYNILFHKLGFKMDIIIVPAARTLTDCGHPITNPI